MKIERILEWDKTKDPMKGALRRSLDPLFKEAEKWDNFKDFKLKAWMVGDRGRYWHLTNDKDFKIDLNRSPTDASSMSMGSGNPGLMLTGDPEWWRGQLSGKRLYAVEFDMSVLTKEKDYHSHNRSFGQEIFVYPSGMKKLKIVRITTAQAAIQSMRKWDNSLPSNDKQLYAVWRAVHPNAPSLEEDVFT